jgi:hypothetical protein
MTSDQPGGPGEPAPPDRHDQPLPSFPTSLGTSGGTTIILLGQDLAQPPRAFLVARTGSRAGTYAGRPARTSVSMATRSPSAVCARRRTCSARWTVSPSRAAATDAAVQRTWGYWGPP